MKKEEIEKLKEKEDQKKQALILKAETLFNSIIKRLEDSPNDCHIAKDIIQKAKWDFDMNRPVYINSILDEYLTEDTKQEYNYLVSIFEEVPLGQSIKAPSNFDRYLDSDKKHIKGDIIITDPCYIIIKDKIRQTLEPKESDYILPIDEYEDVKEVSIAELKKYLRYSDPYYEPINETMCKYSYQRDTALKAYKYDKNEYLKGETTEITDWEATDCGNDVSVLGISNYIGRDTIIGDWSCEVIDEVTNTPIGAFCADSGMVCVAELSEWRKYNPEIDDFAENHNWCATVIKNFDGDVWFEVEDFDDEITDASGQKKFCKDYTVHVVGEGIKDGKPFRFKSF